MDLFMPVMNGDEANKELKLLGINIPVIGVTAGDNCMFEFSISKQIKLDELKEVLSKHQVYQNNKHTLNMLFNVKFIKEVTNDNHKLINELLREYNNNINETINFISANLESKNTLTEEDWDKIKIVAHTLKGASFQLGFELFGYLCSKIEETRIIKNKDMIVSYLNLIKKYYNEFKKTNNVV